MFSCTGNQINLLVGTGSRTLKTSNFYTSMSFERKFSFDVGAWW
jgi:hypothetical protein